MNILLFAEDPGAVNYIAPLALSLQQSGCSMKLLSAGIATSLLQNKGLFTLDIYDGEHAVSELRNCLPSIVVVGTSENLDSPALMLIAEARNRRIPSVGVIDFFANAEYRFRGRSNNALEFAPDWLMVSDADTAQQYEYIGFSKEKIFIAGHPHDDFLMQKKAIFEKEKIENYRSTFFPGIKKNEFALIFVSELSTGLNAKQFQRTDEYTLIGRGIRDGRTEIVLEELLDAIDALSKKGVPRPYLVLRRHPKEKSTNLESYLSNFAWISIAEDPLELIYCADAVVGMSSMLLVESYMLGTPVMSILPRAIERDWLSLTRTNSIMCATQRDEVYSCLQNLLCSRNDFENRKFEASSVCVMDAIIQFLEQAMV